MRELGNEIAAKFPTRVVCFLRWGSGISRTGNGNAFPPPRPGLAAPVGIGDAVQDFIMLPNYLNLDDTEGSLVAHEFGHYLGLYHSFPGWRWFIGYTKRLWEQNLRYAPTKYLPSGTMIGGKAAQYAFTPDPNDAMIYFKCPSMPRHFSKEQIKLMAYTLNTSRSGKAILPDFVK